MFNNKNIKDETKKLVITGVAISALVIPSIISPALNLSITPVHADKVSDFLFSRKEIARRRAFHKNYNNANRKAVKNGKQKAQNRIKNKINYDYKSIRKYHRILNHRDSQLRYAHHKGYNRWAKKLNSAIHYDKKQINNNYKNISNLKYRLRHHKYLI